MKFAAILGAAVLGCAGAASAAEIGVRHTWGHTDRHITNGQFMAETTAIEGYAEVSKGWSFGVKDTSVNTIEGEFVQPEAPEFVSVETDYSTGSFGSPFGPSEYQNDQKDVEVIRPTQFVGSRTEEDSFAIGGSKYGRLVLGGSYTKISESYDFTGSSSTGFSELSTFSR